MISLIIAGGVSMAANAKPIDWPDVNNHTLKGETIPGSQVVCRDMWGTPMLPNGKGGYTLISPINGDFIKESLIQPPQDPRGMVAYRPLPPVDESADASVTLPAPPTVAPSAPPAAQAPASAAPAEASPQPDATAPVAPSDAPAAPAPQ